MDTGQIQLGVKRSSGKSLDRYPTQGFFYWRWRGSLIVAIHTRNIAKSIPVADQLPAKHLILQTIRAVAQWPKAPEMSGNRGRSVGTQPTAIDGSCGGSNPTCSNFYDIPSSQVG